MTEARDNPAGHRLGHYSLGRWAGDTLYMAGVVAMYPGSGRAIRGYADMPEEEAAKFRADHISVDAREQGIVSQTWAIFDITRKHLEAEGLTLDHILHLTVYFTDLRDFPGYHRVRLSVFPQDPPPATVVEVAGLLPTRETLLEIDVIASRQLPRNLTSRPG